MRNNIRPIRRYGEYNVHNRGTCIAFGCGAVKISKATLRKAANHMEENPNYRRDAIALIRAEKEQNKLIGSVRSTVDVEKIVERSKELARVSKNVTKLKERFKNQHGPIVRLANTTRGYRRLAQVILVRPDVLRGLAAVN